jgi:8-oxo-dGTP diphosphatase
LTSKVFLDAKGEQIPYDETSPVTWRVSSHVIALQQNRLLLVEHVHLSGRLELPGGGVEPGESLLEGAVRECWEETGYCFAPIDSEPYFAAEEFFCHKQRTMFRHSLIFAFTGTVSDNPDPAWQPGPKEEGLTVRWVSPADLTPAKLHPHHWSVLLRAGVVPNPPA